MGSPAVVSDPYAAIATPVVAASDPYAAITTPVAPPEQPGYFQSLANNLGLTPPATPPTAKEALIQGIEGPAGAAAKSIYEGGKRTLGELGEAGSALYHGAPGAAAYHAIKSLPVVGSGLDTAVDQHGQGNTLGEFGTLTGTALQATLLRDGVKNSTAPTPLSGPAEETARAITKAVQPGGSPTDKIAFTNDVQNHMGDVVDYGKRTNNPLQTHPDFVKAGKGAAEEASKYYNAQVLDPNGYRVVPVDAAYEGKIANPDRPGFASLKDIDNRLRFINAEETRLRGMPTADANAGRILAGYSTEKAGLLNTLHNSLSEMTGIPPEGIAALRQKSAALHNIADTMNAADVQRLTTGTSSNAPRTKQAAIASGVDYLRGGANKVADARLRDAVKNLPIQPTSLPPITATPPTTIPTTDFLHAHALEQAAQDAAAGRSQAVQTYRNEQAAGNRGLSQQEFLQMQQLEQQAQQAAALRDAQAVAARQANAAKRPPVWTGSTRPEVTGSVVRSLPPIKGSTQ